MRKSAVFFLVGTLGLGILTAGGLAKARTLKPQEASEAPKYFVVWLEQDGQNFNGRNATVMLNRAPFTLVIALDKPRGVLANFSYQDSLYRGFLDKARRLDQIIKLEEFMGVAKGWESPEGVFIAPFQPDYFYYENDKDRSFTDVVKDPTGWLLCKKKISYYSEEPVVKPDLPIQKIKANDLYISLLYEEFDTQGYPVEKQREAMHLIFEDYAALFPPPLKGWTAGDVHAHENSEPAELALFGGGGLKAGIVLDRTYGGRNHAGKLNIAVDSLDMSGFDLLDNDIFSPASFLDIRSERKEPFTYKGFAGLRHYDAQGRLIGVLLHISSNRVMVINAETLGGKNDVMDYLEAVNLDRIQAFFNRYHHAYGQDK